MSTKKKVPIKPLLNFGKMKPEDVLSNSTSIYGKMNNNSNFGPPQAPPLPIDLATLKTANDTLAAAITAAVGGGKQAIAQRNHQKDVVVKLLKQLGHYVEANCKDDMTIFLSSGFTAATAAKTVTPPVTDSIRKIEPGPNAGQMQVWPLKYPGAGAYEVRYAQVPAAGGAPGTWLSQSSLTVRKPIVISSLTPATAYIFQARALTKNGFTDWGDSITRLAL
jgi:hypothetical protein